MSNSEPSAIVLQGIPCMCGLYGEKPQSRLQTQNNNRYIHDHGCRHNFRNDTSGPIGHYGGCALRRSHWIFVVCAFVLHNYCRDSTQTPVTGQ